MSTSVVIAGNGHVADCIDEAGDNLAPIPVATRTAGSQCIRKLYNSERDRVLR